MILVTKICPKNIDCYRNTVTATSWRLQRNVYAPPPLTQRNYAMYCCSFVLLNLMCDSFENTTFKENIQISDIFGQILIKIYSFYLKMCILYNSYLCL